MKNITIGRDDSCDIVIDNERVSRFHASIVQEGNGYIYRDTSSNGTLVNGTMLRNGERFIRFGDQVLLAGNIPLPWNRLQSLIPTAYGAAPYSGRGGGYNQERAYNPPPERGYYEEGYEPDITYHTGTWLIIFGYITAPLGGLLALILGSILVNSKQIVNGKQVNKYKPSSVTNGKIILTIAIISTIIWIIIRVNQ